MGRVGKREDLFPVLVFGILVAVALTAIVAINTLFGGTPLALSTQNAGGAAITKGNSSFGGYALPFDAVLEAAGITTTAHLTADASCPGGSCTVNVNIVTPTDSHIVSQYIYQTGYYSKTNSSGKYWIPFNFTQTPVSGTKWIRNAASSTISSLTTTDSEEYVIAFVCRKYTGLGVTTGFVCGNLITPKWTIQSFATISGSCTSSQALCSGVCVDSQNESNCGTCKRNNVFGGGEPSDWTRRLISTSTTCCDINQCGGQSCTSQGSFVAGDRQVICAISQNQVLPATYKCQQQYNNMNFTVNTASAFYVSSSPSKYCCQYNATSSKYEFSLGACVPPCQSKCTPNNITCDTTNTKLAHYCEQQTNGCYDWSAAKSCKDSSQLCIPSTTSGDSCQNPTCTGTIGFCAASQPDHSTPVTSGGTCLTGSCYTCSPSYTYNSATGQCTASAPTCNPACSASAGLTCTGTNTCTCTDTTKTKCGSVCVDTKTDKSNCGACGTPCAGTCSGGTCTSGGSTCTAQQDCSLSSPACTCTAPKTCVNNGLTQPKCFDDTTNCVTTSGRTLSCTGCSKGSTDVLLSMEGIADVNSNKFAVCCGANQCAEPWNAAYYDGTWKCYDPGNVQNFGTGWGKWVCMPSGAPTGKWMKCDGAGQPACSGSACTTCLDGTTCVANGADKPSNSCQKCAATGSTWVNKADGTSCSPPSGGTCTAGVCGGGGSGSLTIENDVLTATTPELDFKVCNRGTTAVTFPANAVSVLITEKGKTAPPWMWKYTTAWTITPGTCSNMFTMTNTAPSAAFDALGVMSRNTALTLTIDPDHVAIPTAVTKNYPATGTTCFGTCTTTTLTIENDVFTASTPKLAFNVCNRGSNAVTLTAAQYLATVTEKGKTIPAGGFIGPLTITPGTCVQKQYLDFVNLGILNTASAVTLTIDPNGLFGTPVPKDYPATGTTCFGTCGSTTSCSYTSATTPALPTSASGFTCSAGCTGTNMGTVPLEIRWNPKGVVTNIVDTNPPIKYYGTCCANTNNCAFSTNECTNQGEIKGSILLCAMAADGTYFAICNQTNYNSGNYQVTAGGTKYYCLGDGSSDQSKYSWSATAPSGPPVGCTGTGQFCTSIPSPLNVGTALGACTSPVSTTCYTCSGTNALCGTGTNKWCCPTTAQCGTTQNTCTTTVACTGAGQFCSSLTNPANVGAAVGTCASFIDTICYTCSGTNAHCGSATNEWCCPTAAQCGTINSCCPSGQKLCGSSCYNTQTDNQHCGASCTDCTTTGKTCASGTCTCSNPSCVSGTSCVPPGILTDNTKICSAGTIYTCSAANDGAWYEQQRCGYSCVNGVKTYLWGANNNQYNTECPPLCTNVAGQFCATTPSGATVVNGYLCPSGQSCYTCTTAGYTYCSGKNQCFDLDSSPQHCGDCTTVCNVKAGESCIGGMCQ